MRRLFYFLMLCILWVVGMLLVVKRSSFNTFDYEKPNAVDTLWEIQPCLLLGTVSTQPTRMLVEASFNGWSQVFYHIAASGGKTYRTSISTDELEESDSLVIIINMYNDINNLEQD